MPSRMKVFLSWSGESSKAVAGALCRLLDFGFPNVITWMSDREVGAGGRWSYELDREIKSANFGILCLTPDNVVAPWLVFEAGALSHVADSAVVPYCFHVRPDQIADPLT